MSARVLQSRTSDAHAPRPVPDRWLHEVRPGSTGRPGGTAGITDLRTVIAAARSGSAGAARAEEDVAQVPGDVVAVGGTTSRDLRQPRRSAS